MKNQLIKDQLIEKLQSKTATIGVIGLGYVGLPLVLRYAQVGYKVIGFDIDQSKVDTLSKGQSYIERITPSQIVEAQAAGFQATGDFSQICDTDALIICVPTPLDRFREPDLSFILDTMASLLPHLRTGQVVSLESTTYPGTTQEELLPRIEHTGLKVGTDTFLVYSPEREDPGNPNYTTQTIPKVCSGHTKACLAVGMALYGQVVDQVVPVSSTQAAEMTKLLENIHRAVNIGLVNELKVIADKMGIDIHEVINAAATKPFGFVPYYPGPGLGGHCIPIDPFYLTWKAKEFGVHTRFIELAGEINSAMPDYVIAKVMEALNRVEKPVSGSKILVLGIAYKKNIDDMRESPSVVLLQKLQDFGAKVAYSDPHIPIFPKIRNFSFKLNSVDLTQKSIESFDAVLLATDHDGFDYQLISKHAKLLIDTRGKFSKGGKNIIKA